jgi:hypothetical protein
MSKNGTEKEQGVSIGTLGDDEGIRDERVRFIRFLTGQELIAELIEETDDHYKLRNPLAFAARMVPGTNEVNIAFGEFMPFTDEHECDIRKDLVLLCYTPEECIVSQYRQTFSKIIIPTRDIAAGTLLTE